jgi:hypothetical protein
MDVRSRSDFVFAQPGSEAITPIFQQSHTRGDLPKHYSKYCGYIDWSTVGYSSDLSPIERKTSVKTVRSIDQHRRIEVEQSLFEEIVDLVGPEFMAPPESHLTTMQS